MINYNISKEREKHPYKYYGKIFEVSYQDTDFVLRSALNYVVDDYDEYLGSVEQSHYEEAGFNIVYNYNQFEESNELDFTWMHNNDIFRIVENDQNKRIRTVKTNIDNLGYSTLPVENDMFQDIDLEVYDNESKMSIFNKVRFFNEFISKHRKALSGNIVLEGFGPITRVVLKEYAKEYGLRVVDKHQKHKINTKY